MKKILLALLLAVSMVGFVEAADKKKKKKKKDRAKVATPVKENDHAALFEEASGKVVMIRMDSMQTRILQKKRQKGRKRVRRGTVREEDMDAVQRAPIYLSAKQIKAINDVLDLKRKKWPKRVIVYVDLEDMKPRKGHEGLWIKRAAVQFSKVNPSDPNPAKK